MLLLVRFSCNKLDRYGQGEIKNCTEERAYLLLFIKVVGRTAHKSLINVFQLVCLQSRKHSRPEMPVVDINIPATCNKGMRIA